MRFITHILNYQSIKDNILVLQLLQQHEHLTV